MSAYVKPDFVPDYVWKMAEHFSRQASICSLKPDKAEQTGLQAFWQNRSLFNSVFLQDGEGVNFTAISYSADSIIDLYLRIDDDSCQQRTSITDFYSQLGNPAFSCLFQHCAHSYLKNACSQAGYTYASTSLFFLTNDDNPQIRKAAVFLRDGLGDKIFAEFIDRESLCRETKSRNLFHWKFISKDRTMQDRAETLVAFKDNIGDESMSALLTSRHFSSETFWSSREEHVKTRITLRQASSKGFLPELLSELDRESDKSPIFEKIRAIKDSFASEQGAFMR